MTDFRLADAVNASKPLLKPIWVPRQVIVDHEMCTALQVNTLARCVVGYEDAHFRVVI